MGGFRGHNMDFGIPGFGFGNFSRIFLFEAGFSSSGTNAGASSLSSGGEFGLEGFVGSGASVNAGSLSNGGALGLSGLGGHSGGLSSSGSSANAGFKIGL
ncbi:unnamed protein product [Chironomus riparius]|uniref:Uncharacterized protein n=1 Tax=Chironomus riparius TaxID=315576 RepID=A0A9P0NQI2_9DIPT|nr:unnamed protein product [Chironomus riparius]